MPRRSWSISVDVMSVKAANSNFQENGFHRPSTVNFARQLAERRSAVSSWRPSSSAWTSSNSIKWVAVAERDVGKGQGGDFEWVGAPMRSVTTT